MFDLIDSALTSYNMLSGVNKVIVGLSGGADSMCLLHFLASKSEYYGIKVEAAHINHCLRGQESERDCDFVKDQCDKMNIAVHIKRADIAAIAAEKKIGLEQCGREVRYRFFDELASDENTVIATAHTASDNAETVLLNITRGCGLDGLAGIPPVRGKIIRPLINAYRSDIENYCNENSVAFVTDSTNLMQDYSRNKIRLSVLPTLSLINSSVEKAVNRVSQTASIEAAFLTSVADKEYHRCITQNGIYIPKLKEVDQRLLPRVVKLAVECQLGCVPEKCHVDLICRCVAQGHGAVMPHGRNRVRVSGEYLVFDKVDEEIVKTNASPVIDARLLNLNTAYRFGGKTIIISPLKKGENYHNGCIVNKKLVNQRISCDIISDGAVLRNRQSGDTFKPIGRGCTKTLKKLFTELKIPQEKRSTLLVAAVGSNVCWIEGIGVSQDCLAGGNSDFFVIEVSYDE